jgi:hypothetical protein
MEIRTKPKLETWTKNFSQESDTCSSDTHQDIIIRQDDGGGGPFWILETNRWAIDSIDEMVELLQSAGVEFRKDQAKVEDA